MCVCLHMRTGGVRSAGAEVQTVASYLTWGPDIELVSSVRAVCALDHQAIPPAPVYSYCEESSSLKPEVLMPDWSAFL